VWAQFLMLQITMLCLFAFDLRFPERAGRLQAFLRGLPVSLACARPSIKCCAWTETIASHFPSGVCITIQAVKCADSANDAQTQLFRAEFSCMPVKGGTIWLTKALQ
jgi:hypothetical protein